jgi:hypothetical protein
MEIIGLYYMDDDEQSRRRVDRIATSRWNSTPTHPALLSTSTSLESRLQARNCFQESSVERKWNSHMLLLLLCTVHTAAADTARQKKKKSDRLFWWEIRYQQLPPSLSVALTKSLLINPFYFFLWRRCQDAYITLSLCLSLSLSRQLIPRSSSIACRVISIIASEGNEVMTEGLVIWA